MNRLVGIGRSRTGRLGLVAGVVVALLVGLSAPAFAHHAIVSGSTYCANNDHVVTWSIGNSESNRSMNIDSATATVGNQSYAVTGYTSSVPNSGTTSATSVVPGPVTGTITLTVKVTWPSDNVHYTATADVSLVGTCGCECTTTSSTTTTEPTTTTTEPTTTTTTHHCGCTTTTTATTTTTEPTTTTTEPTTTTTQYETTTTLPEETTTTTMPTTTSTQALGSTTIVTTTTLGHQGSTVPTTGPTTTAATPIKGELPFTGSGIAFPVAFGIASLILGAALAFRKRGSWSRS